MSKTYRIEEGSLHERFQASRAKVQMFAGGFGNGKTTAAVIKALNLAKDYPGSNGLVARSTYPKLTNTIRKEFRDWTPKAWVKRDIDSKQNLMELTNGSIINFSHVAQTGKNTEASTSNLLSATYDWIVIDQVEDPEITEKDFLDLLGRLRGQTTYKGTDDTMPTSGPRWIILMCNPTRNWVYRKLVKPLHDHAKGVPNSNYELDEKGNPMVEVFEGSTYENAKNLTPDFIHTQENMYKGQMKQRYLLGEWGAYEGLIYPSYDPAIHMIPHEVMNSYYIELANRGANMVILEAYDHGIAVPSCYLFGFSDDAGNVMVMDGIHEKELSPEAVSKAVFRIRRDYGYYDGSNFGDPSSLRILADPAIFRRQSGNSKTVGTTTSGLFRECGLNMIRGNNDVINGIIKVQSYMHVDSYHKNPFYEERTDGAPRLYFSNRLEFIDREVVDYYWKKDTAGEYEDEPNGKNDHAMDALKYLLTNRPRVVTFNKPKEMWALPSQYRRWTEGPDVGSNNNNRKHRHAA